MADESEDARLTVEQALAMLPDGESVHVFMNPQASVLLGADWERDTVVKAITDAHTRKLTGPHAMEMGHGLACDYRNDWIFIETRKAAEAKAKQGRAT